MPQTRPSAMASSNRHTARFLLSTPIVYPIAIVKGRRTQTVKAAMHFFQSDTAAAVFQRYGFRVLDSGPKKNW